MDREPAHGNGPAGPFLTIGGETVWALGDQRFRIVAPVAVEEVEGFEDARRRARQLAGD